MMVQVKVSLGELVDKLSILKIKKQKINDTQKLVHVENELKVLQETLDNLQLEGISSYEEELFKINSELWDIEDCIREKEKAKEFDSDFIEIARSVYVTNDLRFDVKNRCNQHFGSSLQEVKSYEKYD